MSERQKLYVNIAMWFVGAIVIPVTTGFLVVTLQLSISEARQGEKILHLQKSNLKTEKKVDNIFDKLEAIHKDVGELKGEVKRISRD